MAGRRNRPRGMSEADTARWFLRHAVVDGECRIAQASLTKAGYPVATINKRTAYLHRLSLEARIGRPLQAGEFACHRCHKPACINPNHLYAGSHRENMSDMVQAGRAAPMQRIGEAAPNRKLTANQVRDIRRRYAAGAVTLAELANLHEVAATTISAVVNRVNWKHL